jgi:HAD superfamily hydrolase (TIGR01509 family)
MSAILFGSISTVADTSELQRQAFNQAFETHGLDWKWDREQYRELLAKSGGQGRIAEFAKAQGETVDAAAVHRTKSSIFQESLASSGLSPRAGVVDTIKAAKSEGWKVGLVTTTSGENITALLNALAPDIASSDFDVIVDASDVEQPKPDKAAYEFAVTSLGESVSDCVAIEDNVEGVEAALAEGVACVAFPNENTAAHEFAASVQRVDHLDVSELQQLTGGAA